MAVVTRRGRRISRVFSGQVEFLGYSENGTKPQPRECPRFPIGLIWHGHFFTGHSGPARKRLGNIYRAAQHHPADSLLGSHSGISEGDVCDTADVDPVQIDAAATLQHGPEIVEAGIVGSKALGLAGG